MVKKHFHKFEKIKIDTIYVSKLHFQKTQKLVNQRLL